MSWAHVVRRDVRGSCPAFQALQLQMGDDRLDLVALLDEKTFFSMSPHVIAMGERALEWGG